MFQSRANSKMRQHIRWKPIGDHIRPPRVYFSSKGRSLPKLCKCLSCLLPTTPDESDYRRNELKGLRVSKDYAFL